ncbi:hypothetical protein GGI43DRAFT_425670 [Trichoderma evansii]
MAPPWTRLIRFVAEEDGHIHLGQVDANIPDIGIATFEGTPISAKLIEGSLYNGVVSDTVMTVKQLLPPVSIDQRSIIRCLGLNYRDHAKESNMPIPEVPVLFFKPPHALMGPWPEKIRIPKFVQDGSSDYEAELTLIISKTGKNIAEEDAFDHVLGYTCGNDVSARTEQFKTSQWSFSKGLDASAPIGPVLVSQSAIGDPHNLSIRAIYNGAVVQDSNTSQMIFSIPKIISFLSQGTTLEQGTIIMTGTPPGIGCMRDPKIYLRDGDDIRVQIGKIGTLINAVYYENSRVTLHNRRGSRTTGLSTRTDGATRHSSGGVMNHAGHTSSEDNISATRLSPLEDTSCEDLGRLTPNSSQWSRGTATVSLSHLESISLSDMMHPSHDMPYSQRSPGEVSAEAPRTLAESDMAIWNHLEISQQAYDELLEAYFQNMSTFSLFHKPEFHSKLGAVSSNSESAALVASMFIFSSRFLQDSHKRRCSFPETFHALARKYIAAALDECSEDAPSLCVLQALILSTFHQLSQDVRGLAWRSLGVCIRVAYEINLHKIDAGRIANQKDDTTYEKEQWILDEERRRAWWAIWELDVFACTVRRLPTGLDSMQTETFLPVSDEAWFGGMYQPSCCLDLDPKARWKMLEKCANHSWKSWYIVLNSMMRDAHVLSYSRGMYSMASFNSNAQSAISSSASFGTISDGLKALEESLSSFGRALPKEISYCNEYLGFHSKTSMETQSTLTNDCATHSLYMMTQLTRFMIYHYQMFWDGRTMDSASAEDLTEESGNQQYRLPTYSVSTEAWNRYLESADNILRMIRNSSPYHVRYVNPLFASTIWIAAVAQVSKLEVLQHNFDGYVSFWGTSRALQHKLNTLESRLQNVQRRQSKGYGSPSTDNRNLLARDQPQDSTTRQSLGVNSGHQDLLLDSTAPGFTGVDVTLDPTSAFYSCGPFGLPADIVNSAWPMDLTSMKYNPSDVFNYDALDFLNYSFNGS